MSRPVVSRRFMVHAMGVGAAAAAAGVGARVAQSDSRAVLPVEPEAGPEQVDPAREQSERLIAPLAAGSTLGGWTIERVLPVEGGAASVVVVDAAQRKFQLDICARDEREPRGGPAQTEHFEVFLANGGDGETATFEEHGLAAMALAEVIRHNEAHVDRASFTTLAARRGARVFVT
jgi:hypothetical protein